MTDSWARQIAERVTSKQASEEEPAEPDLEPGGKDALQQRAEEIAAGVRDLEARRTAARKPASGWAARAAARMRGEDDGPDAA